MVFINVPDNFNELVFLCVKDCFCIYVEKIDFVFTCGNITSIFTFRNSCNVGAWRALKLV